MGIGVAPDRDVLAVVAPHVLEERVTAASGALVLRVLCGRAEVEVPRLVHIERRADGDHGVCKILCVNGIIE